MPASTRTASIGYTSCCRSTERLLQPDCIPAQSSQRGAATPALPKRKISDTVIDFGAPVLRDLDSAQPIEIVRATFSLVITVWNAHVMAMPIWGKPEVLEQLEDLLRTPGTPTEMTAACADLATRRQQHFANDPRAVAVLHPLGNSPLRRRRSPPPAALSFNLAHYQTVKTGIPGRLGAVNK